MHHLRSAIRNRFKTLVFQNTIVLYLLVCKEARMIDYTTKTYGRNHEVEAIYRMFQNDRDVAMPGPRRLGKTFVLERIVDRGAALGWHAIKIDIAGCTDARSVFRRLCEMITKQHKGSTKAVSLLRQRLGQITSPRSEPGGSWYQPLLSLDYETWFERLVRDMHNDTSHRWALLIDELPIFLKALHDRGSDGVAQALSFMNLLSRLREDNKRVRWLITGSIGIEPLARAGNYMGVLAKFDIFGLKPLTEPQARDYVHDLASMGRLASRSVITEAESTAIVAAVGWPAAFYLEVLSQKLTGQPGNDPAEAAQRVAQAVESLLQPEHAAAFGTWEEHLRKHYPDPDREIAFTALEALAPHPEGLSVDTALTTMGRTGLTREQLRAVLIRLHTEGFVTVEGLDGEEAVSAFRNPLLRRWWQRYKPRAKG
jgi:uncharacterized protein